MSSLKTGSSTWRWAPPLVRWRHPLLLVFVLTYTWIQRSPSDWALLTDSSKALFSSSGLSVYANHENLQVGAPALVIIRGFALLPGGGENAAHVLLAILGWHFLRLAERWYVPGAGFFSAPLVEGLTTLVVGLPVLLVWTSLSGGCAHVEDALTLWTFALAGRAISQGQGRRAGLLVGLCVAFKPWGLVALPMLRGLPRMRAAIAVALAIPTASWLPFLLADPATVGAAGRTFFIQPNSTIHLLGVSTAFVPSWWRTLELLVSLAIAVLAARRRGWQAAFAAGCCARLLLDPAAFDYYVAGLIMATAITERMTGLKPWRTLLLCVTMMSAQDFMTDQQSALLRLPILTILLTSWLTPSNAKGRGADLCVDSPALPLREV